jgi:hypothetical protein
MYLTFKQFEQCLPGAITQHLALITSPTKISFKRPHNISNDIVNPTPLYTDDTTYQEYVAFHSKKARCKTWHSYLLSLPSKVMLVPAHIESWTKTPVPRATSAPISVALSAQPNTSDFPFPFKHACLATTLRWNTLYLLYLSPSMWPVTSLPLLQIYQVQSVKGGVILWIALSASLQLNMSNYGNLFFWFSSHTYKW